MLAADDGTPMHAHIVVSLLTGARTEEMRGLQWDHVIAFDERRQAWIPVPEAGWNHEKVRDLRDTRPPSRRGVG